MRVTYGEVIAMVRPLGALLRVAVAVAVCAVTAPIAAATGTAAATPAGPRVVERVSLSAAGAQANRSSGFGLQCHTDCTEGVPPAMSADGRFVAFVSDASTLVTGDSNGTADVFVHDRQTGTTERVSGDGRYVAFSSYANNLVAGDTNQAVDVFVRDLRADRTWRLSVSAAGHQANAESQQVALAADGRRLSYASSASNLVPGDTNGVPDIFTTSVPRGAAAAPPRC